VAEHLGNTPAVARSAYVDPRLISLYEHGSTIEKTLQRLDKRSQPSSQAQLTVERAVIRLLS
jgi:DNA topoisomerase IB